MSKTPPILAEVTEADWAAAGKGWTHLPYLARFADSGIDLELGFWIGDPESGQLNVRSELNLAIWRDFQREGIEIPYPRREVRLLPSLENEAKPL